MDTGEIPQSRRKLSTWLVPAIGYAVSLASLWWAFRRFPVAELGERLRTMSWGWLSVAVGLEIASFLLDAWRWRELLRPAALASYGTSLQAVFAGAFANDLVPARAGEAVRCFLLSYKEDIHLPLVITSVVILRVMDGIWVAIFYFGTTLGVEGAGVATVVLSVYAAVVVSAALLLLFVLFRGQHAHRFVSKTSWAARFTHFLDEVHKLGNWRELGRTMAASGLYWVIQICAVWTITRADHFYFSFGQMAFLQIVKSVGTLVPTAPAAVGAFQASAIYALRHFFTEPPDAKILAELLFGFLTLPGLIGGAIATAMAGFKLKDLVRHAQEAHRKHKAGDY